MLDELYEQLKYRVLEDIDKLTLLLKDDEKVLKRILFCKNTILNNDGDASSKIAAICYIKELVDFYNIHNKVHLVVEDDLSKKSYVR